MSLILGKGKYAVWLAIVASPLLMSAATPQDVVRPIVQQVLDVSRILIIVMMLLSVVALGWGIVKLILAAGDPAAAKKARGVLLWGVIGITVFVSLFALITFIQRYFGVTETGAIKAPTVDLIDGPIPDF